MSIQDYRDLEVWQRGRQLVRTIYHLSAALPAEERYGLISQMRRAVVSIPANIAEGWGRHYPAEFIQFIRVANGSRVELETHLILTVDLNFLREEQIQPAMTESTVLGKQLLALERSLNSRRRT